jgi:hypothetical protein
MVLDTYYYQPGPNCPPSTLGTTWPDTTKVKLVTACLTASHWWTLELCLRKSIFVPSALHRSTEEEKAKANQQTLR